MGDVPAGFENEVDDRGRELRLHPQPVAELSAVRAAGKGGRPLLRGYGSVFDTPFRIEGMFSSWDEEVAPGAFTDAIRGTDVRSMFNHDTNWLLGRTASGSLRLSQDSTGLRYEVDINPDDSNAMSVHARVDRGDVDGSSIWFRVAKQEWTHPTKSNGLEVPLRRILKVDPLYEVGPVVFPANVAAGVATRDAGGIDRDLLVRQLAHRPHRLAPLLQSAEGEGRTLAEQYRRKARLMAKTYNLPLDGRLA